MSDIDRRRYEGILHQHPGEVYYHESAVREVVRGFGEYGDHDSNCVAGQWRQGRPTAGGGYETLFGHGMQEKWYQRDESPPCTCGLSDLLAHYKELLSE